LDTFSGVRSAPEDYERLRGSVLKEARPFKVRELARESGVSLGEVSTLLRGQGKPKRETLLNLRVAIPRLQAAHQYQDIQVQSVLEAVREHCRHMSVRQFAAEAGIGADHLIQALNGRQRPSRAMLKRLEDKFS
jgi:transcriptional regulator with XRE-family HTH domain